MISSTDLLKLLAAILGSALAMLAWSEFVFFNEGVAQGLRDGFAQSPWSGIRFVLMFAGFYCVASGFLVGLMGLFGSDGVAKVMILGALTGFAIEGTVVDAVYEAVPFSYLWTSVAWHGPITVALGVFALPRLLSLTSLSRVALWAMLIGASWGLWMTWTWGIEETARLTLMEFSIFVLQTVVIMAVGYALLFAAGWPRLVLPRGLCLVLMLPAIALFILQGSGVPLFGAGLALIMAALIFLLRWMGPDTAKAIPLRPQNLFFLVLMPVSAIAAYWVCLQTGPLIPSEDLVLLFAGGGLLVWIWGIVVGVRRPRPAAA